MGIDTQEVLAIMFSILGSGSRSAAKTPVAHPLPTLDLEVPDVLDTATFANG